MRYAQAPFIFLFLILFTIVFKLLYISVFCHTFVVFVTFVCISLQPRFNQNCNIWQI